MPPVLRTLKIEADEGEDQTEAATRIQAIYRGRKARQKCQVRRLNAGVRGSVGSAGPAMRGTALGPVPVKVPNLSLYKRSSSSGQGQLASRGSEGRMLTRPGDPTSSGSSSLEDAQLLRMMQTMSTDYTLMQRGLEERPSNFFPPHIQRWRVCVYMAIEEPRSSLFAQVLSILLLAMIITSIVCFMIETMPELKHVPKDVWLTIEVICTVSFTIEYIVRLAVCGVVGISTKQFVKNSMNIIDLLAILPFYIWVAMRSFSIAKALGVLRTIRLVRLFRIFKLGRYSSGLQLMAEALKNSSQALWVLSFFLCIGILLFSSAVYYVEKMECPDVDDLKGMPHLYMPSGNLTEWDRYAADCRLSKDGFHSKHGLCCDEYGSPFDFPSIIEAFWWSAVTMTTVGFGDSYPRTELGRLVATATMLSGILLIALPVAIIGRKFQEVYELKEYRDAMGEGSTSIELISQGEKSIASNWSEAESFERRTTKREAAPKRVEPQEKALEGPTLSEMSKRLRNMKLPDANMKQLASELAEELEDANDMQQEIKSMHSEEKDRQAQVLENFDGLLKRLTELLDPPIEPKRSTKSVSWANLGKAPRGLTSLVVSAVKSKSGPLEAGAGPPLPPPMDAPPDDAGMKVEPAESPRAEDAQPPGMVASPEDAPAA